MAAAAKNGDGMTKTIIARVTPSQAKQIDVWRRQQRPALTRSDAIRKLIDKGFVGGVSAGAR